MEAVVKKVSFILPLCLLPATTLGHPALVTLGVTGCLLFVLGVVPMAWPPKPPPG